MAKQSTPHQSWLPDANDPTTDFPLTHLPYGAFIIEDQQHLCVAIGIHLLDLHVCAACGLLPPKLVEACQASTLNLLMSQGRQAWTLLRRSLTALLHADAESEEREKIDSALHSLAGANLGKPVHIPNYTDFYASLHHAVRVGQLFRPDQPLLPNYKYVPIGYHGRASSIVVSGQPITRPRGQLQPLSIIDQPNYLATKALDYELELALYIGHPSLLGNPVPIDESATHLFGISLLNDWSARDIQSWEYQPLGPFLAKSFATSVSAWVTPVEALDAFRAPAATRPSTDPKPLDYLHSVADQKRGVFKVKLEVLISTAMMRAHKLQPVILSKSESQALYWTPAQLIAHHTSNGCNLQVGDILATGTISGPNEDSAGCLLELTRNGAKPILLPTGETRSFLDDGDEIILRGSCEAHGRPRLGLGECRAVVLPAQI